MSPIGTRQKLLDAAEDLLDDGGPAAVTLREVGRRGGVSHNAPYKHFSSKERLLAELAAREMTRLQEKLVEDRAAGLDAATAVTRSVREQVTRAVAHPERYRLIYGRWDSTDLVDRVAVESSALFAQTVADAQAAGAIAAGDPERIAALLRAVVRGAAELQSAGHLAADGKGRADAIDLVDDLLSLLRLS
ncbi:transcriptional regulator, TetR family [Rathayibacter oskolensis]|uniref:Transcriptional regulator, TetR family n=1 Tax=Rathayibacter oskolensis TaxID=1891671 RepID=A0A1X7P6N8_9MICO|nr:TetR/AcrR family transcriptional regulator [Rathayibacter oskolensis]SMH46479.1 transcriptional regulator, TetR family [Rathayibacter oskolensis]